MDREHLLRQQERLQRESNLILEELNLLSFISQYGRACVAGSVALGLMVWPDIDVDVEVDEIDEGRYWETARYLLAFPQVMSLFLVDNRSQIERDRPESMYIGIRYLASTGQQWKIDLRFVPTHLAYARLDSESLRSKLTEEDRLTILDIKERVSTHPEYRQKITSIDVYRAVLEYGAQNLDDLRAYLGHTGSTL